MPPANSRRRARTFLRRARPRHPSGSAGRRAGRPGAPLARHHRKIRHRAPPIGFEPDKSTHRKLGHLTQRAVEKPAVPVGGPGDEDHPGRRRHRHEVEPHVGAGLRVVRVQERDAEHVLARADALTSRMRAGRARSRSGGAARGGRGACRPASPRPSRCRAWRRRWLPLRPRADRVARGDARGTGHARERQVGPRGARETAARSPARAGRAGCRGTSSISPSVTTMTGRSDADAADERRREQRPAAGRQRCRRRHARRRTGGRLPTARRESRASAQRPPAADMLSDASSSTSGRRGAPATGTAEVEQQQAERRPGDGAAERGRPSRGGRPAPAAGR